MQLRIPGPTPCPQRVLQAMARQMINHRGKEFAEILVSSTNLLKYFFQTKSDVFILTASGTGGMEAAVVNLLSPGDEVLGVSNGYFGERLCHIARCYGAQLHPLDFPWGKPVDPEAVRQALREKPGIKAVLVVHNETSTGLTNPIKEISQVVKGFEKLLVVDAISSLSALELRTDEWGIDVAITASQKGWMAPPGLAMLSFSPRAWQAHAQSRMPRYYWDLSLAKRYLEKGQTAFTPAISTMYALLSALELMREEGLEAIQQRHHRVGNLIRQGVKGLGLSLFPEERFASDTVSAISLPREVNVHRLLELAEEGGAVLAPGQGKLESQVLRIGHLGWVNEEDARIILQVLTRALEQVGFVPVGR